MISQSLRLRVYLVAVSSIAITALLFVMLQKADRLVVNFDGNVEGKVMRLKEWAQGKDFWENQLSYVQNELDRPAKLLKLLENLGRNDRIAEDAIAISNDVLSRSSNEHVQKFLASESYQLKEESERLMRHSERLKRFELLNASYQNSLLAQEKYLKLKSIIELKISAGDR